MPSHYCKRFQKKQLRQRKSWNSKFLLIRRQNLKRSKRKTKRLSHSNSSGCWSVCRYSVWRSSISLRIIQLNRLMEMWLIHNYTDELVGWLVGTQSRRCLRLERRSSESVEERLKNDSNRVELMKLANGEWSPSGSFSKWSESEAAKSGESSKFESCVDQIGEGRLNPTSGFRRTANEMWSPKPNPLASPWLHIVQMHRKLGENTSGDGGESSWRVVE